MDVWVKKAGDPDFVKLHAEAADVADLKDQTVEKLPSLKGTDLSTITLHVANDKMGESLQDALESTDSASEAIAKAKTAQPAGLADDKIRIVVKMAMAASAKGAAAPVAVDGEFYQR